MLNSRVQKKDKDLFELPPIPEPENTEEIESEDEDHTFVLNLTAISVAVAFASIFTYFCARLLMLITHQFILFVSNL